MSESARRALALIGVLAVTAVAAWWSWPHPALDLRVDRGGQGVIVDRWGRTSALPETVFIASTGRNTRVRLSNRDTSYQTLGIFGAAAGSVRTFKVPLPGTYGGYCSAHASSGQITYIVR